MSNHLAWTNPDGSVAVVGSSTGAVTIPPGGVRFDGDPIAARRAEFDALVEAAAPDRDAIAATIAANHATDLAALIASGIPEQTARRMLGS